MPTAAIWGTGFIAEIHVKALRALGIPIVSTVSRDCKKAEAFAKQWDIPVFSDDPETLLSADCVHICTPPALHGSEVRFLLENGKHILCEKPFCLEPEEAYSLARLAREKGLVGAVNFNNRFHPACLRAKKAASDLGGLLSLSGSYLQQFGICPVPMGWRYQPSLAGEMHAMTEIGSHWTDLAEWIGGRKILAVSARFDSVFPDRWEKDGMLYAERIEGGSPFRVESEDAAALRLRFAGGLEGSVFLSEITPNKYNELILELRGEKKTLRWNSEEASRLQITEGKETTTEAFPEEDFFTDSFAALAKAVCRDIENGTPSEMPDYPDFFDGAHNAAICRAAYESASRGSEWVTITEEETR